MPLRLYGQELNHVTYAIAKMNMIIHDMDGEIAIGYSLKNPKFLDDSALKHFEIAVANPMWNQPGYGSEFYDNDDPVFVDTNGNSREKMHFVNTGEVSIIKNIVEGYQSMGINNIIVTTPYKQQERMLQLNLQKGLRIGTIDKFQGQEDEVTIISMVRSNTNVDYQQSLGFVNIPRSCVAFSRSKRKTIIVGDRDTLIKSRFLSQSIDTITGKDGFLIWRDSDS